jgi:hypothetical protein
MPLYARYAVAFAWLIDPQARTLEAYQLQGGDWQELGRFAGADQVAVLPFEAVTIDLDGLWLPHSPKRHGRQSSARSMRRHLPPVVGVFSSR